MREIKFRGKRTDTGEWVTGDFLNSIPEHDAYICDKGYCVIGCIDATTADFIQAFAVCVDPDTISQYTGLKDKNGREIYEGDVVKAWFPPMPHDMRCLQEIMFVDGCFGCGDYPLKIMDLLLVEVVGNLFENPELLEEGA